MKNTMKMLNFWIIFLIADIKAGLASKYKAVDVMLYEFFNFCRTYAKVASVSFFKITTAVKTLINFGNY
jgi:hypothetical protein